MADSSPQLPDRIQRDLEEALRDGGVDKLPSRPSRKRRRSFRPGMPDPRPRDPGQLVLVGVGLFIIGAFVLRGAGFGGYLVLIGVACVALAVATYLIHPQGQQPKYWRGKYLDVPSGTWQDRLYRAIYRQR